MPGEAAKAYADQARPYHHHFGSAMKQDLSLMKNLAQLADALWGTRAARDSHRRTMGSSITIQSGLETIRTRWPDLQSRNETAPIFVFSAGWRSGSTFLQRWIMTAREVLIWGEPYRHAGVIRSLAGQLRAFTHDWPWDQFFASPGSSTDDLTQKWIANLYPPLAAFMDAHIGYFEKLFRTPALEHGKSRWGLKEVTLSVAHACYLQWLFPEAKFVFLYRNPYNAYGSYRKWRSLYRTWPAEPVFTATRYGAIWRGLATDFLENHHRVSGLLLRYEDLKTEATKAQLESYLGLRLAQASSLARVSGTRTNNQTSPWMPKLEAFLLKRQVEPVSLRLGYRRGRTG